MVYRGTKKHLSCFAAGCQEDKNAAVIEKSIELCYFEIKGGIVMSIDLNSMPRLGFGLMRLPKIDEKIDLEQVCRMVDFCMDAGMNYFDTAYIYHGGESEGVLKKTVTERYPRERFLIATKLPAWCMNRPEDRDRIFNEQLKRCGVEYFDFYLLHSVEEGSNGETYENMDCYRWGLEKKKEGLIRHFGFSFHGSPAYLEKTLDAHPEIEFVQVQINYADWVNPVVRSREVYKTLYKRGIPIIVMEPVKGGTLARLAPELEERFRAIRPDDSAASWALRFVGSLPGVMTILSGMSTEAQVFENIRTFENFEPLNELEQKTVAEVRDALLSTPLIGCTACLYCTDGCPMRIPIPEVFRALNTMRVYHDEFRPKAYYKGITAHSGRAGECIGCRQCETVCPQHLKIVDLLGEASRLLEA